MIWNRLVHIYINIVDTSIYSFNIYIHWYQNNLRVNDSMAKWFGMSFWILIMAMCFQSNFYSWNHVVVPLDKTLNSTYLCLLALISWLSRRFKRTAERKIWSQEAHLWTGNFLTNKSTNQVLTYNSLKSRDALCFLTNGKQ